MQRPPRSASDLTGGIVYFARMCDKIRLHAAGELPPGYMEHLGKGSDGRLCEYLRVNYEALKVKVLSGADDADIFEWCRQIGRGLTEIDVLVWNGFARKRGWEDPDGPTEMLEKFKADAGLAGRQDIRTFFEFYDADEGRV